MSGVDGLALLARQRAAKTDEDRYAVLDFLQKWLGGDGKARRTKQFEYSAVRSFFLHNRCALPQDPSFKIRSNRVTVAPKLAVEHIHDIVKNATLRDRSLILVKWMALLDTKRLVHVGEHLSGQVVDQIKKEMNPVRLDLPSRKQNERPWFTFIGKDAVDALKEYFEKERGWPKANEPIWLNHIGKAITVEGFKEQWIRLCRRCGLVPVERSDSPGTRYGFNTHETRDVAKSLLHTHAKAQGFDMDCAEFWLGHTVDPLGYDKFYKDQEYVKKQYLIAERHLNILSTPRESEQVQQQDERIKSLETQLQDLRQMITAGISQLEKTPKS